jgi:ParB family chromosome partitioning protein
VAEIRNVQIQDIQIGDRHRKELGDIAALAKSIAEVGLLQPLVVTDDLRLVAGARRLAAVKELGWRLVPARVYVVDGFVADGFDADVDGFDDALALLKAERDENTCRKNFTPSEAVAIGRALEELEREQARARQRATRAARGQKVGTAQGGGNFPPPSGGRGKARDKVAEAVGMSGRTYEKAKAVVAAAEANPALAPVVEDMDRTGKVDPAFQKVKGRQESAGAADTEPPPGSMPGPGAADAAAPAEWVTGWRKLKDVAWQLGHLAAYARRMARTRVAERYVEDVEHLLVECRKVVTYLEAEVLGKHEAEQADGETPDRGAPARGHDA